MVERDTDGARQVQPRSRGLLPPELVELLNPSLKFGAGAAVIGGVYGVAFGIVHDFSPPMAALASSIQWFTVGSSYWFTRTVTMRAWGGAENLRPSDKTKISAFSGGTAGMVSGLLRGPRAIVPAVVVWTLVGAGGQAAVNKAEEMRAAPETAVEDSWLRSKWSPLKRLTDDEYMEMMSEKILKLEVEMALIDDKIAALREAEKKAKAEAQAEAATTTAPRPSYKK